MNRHLRAAAIAIPTALLAYAPVQKAEAHPMVAVGWLWAAGAGGLLLGFLGGNAYAYNHGPIYGPVQADAVAAPDYSACHRVTVRYHGAWRHAIICD